MWKFCRLILTLTALVCMYVYTCIRTYSIIMCEGFLLYLYVCMHFYSTYHIAQNVGGRKYIGELMILKSMVKKMLANCKICGTLFTTHLESDSTVCDITSTWCYVYYIDLVLYCTVNGRRCRIIFVTDAILYGPFGSRNPVEVEPFLTREK